MVRVFLVVLHLALIFCLGGCTSTPAPTSSPRPVSTGHRINLSDGDRQIIGRKIWENECGGSVSGLTSWNEGEDFPSLGIGHFIWYVEGRPGPFEESFPGMISYLVANGVSVPRWIVESPGSPWRSRGEFRAAKDSQKMRDLRSLLAATVREQTGFIIGRLERSLPAMKAESAPGDRSRIESNFYALANNRSGMYALIDYVNFKGEGISASEKYRNQGWGLRDVLIEMRPGSSPPHHRFSDAAKTVLRRRVANSPPERGENRWLQGWMNRCESYREGI